MTKHELRKRVHIKADAVKIRNSSETINTTHLLPGQNADGTFLDPHRTWKIIKPEAYQLFAVLSDDLIEGTLHDMLNMSENDLQEKLQKKSFLGNRDVFNNFRQYMIATLLKKYKLEKKFLSVKTFG